jgi:hypothetical protein
MAANLPEPLAQGDLEKTPFAHVLLYVKKHELSGTLVVWSPEPGDEKPKQDRVRFEQGVPVAGRLLERASRLDRAMLPLFARTSGPYAFYADVDLVGVGDGVRAGRVEIYMLIAASLRGGARDDAVDAVIAGLGDSKMRLKPGIDLDAYSFMPGERQLIDALRAEPMSVRRLAEISPLSARMAERLMYLLTVTKAIAPWEEDPRTAVERMSAPPSTPTPPPRRDPPARKRDVVTPPPPMPDDLAAEHRGLWTEIVERATVIEDQNYFDMLGVPRDASSAAIQKAYFNLVKKWHPDRIPPELGALRETVERIFRYLTRAQEVLSDEEQRGPYLVSVQDGGGTPAAERQLGRIVHAALEYRKVEIMIRRREWNEALALLDEILGVADDEPDYHATRGWVLFSQNPNDSSVRPPALAAIQRAIDLNAKHDRAHLWKGMILARAERTREAEECFRRAAELNPKNIEAQRMVRLADMRKKDEPSTPSTPASGPSPKRDSLFDKLFTKKKK